MDFVPIIGPVIRGKRTYESPTTEISLFIPVTARLTGFVQDEKEVQSDENQLERRHTISLNDQFNSHSVKKNEDLSRPRTLQNLCSISRRDFKIVKARKFRKRKKNYTILIIRRRTRFNDAF